ELLPIAFQSEDRRDRRWPHRGSKARSSAKEESSAPDLQRRERSETRAARRPPTGLPGENIPPPSRNGGQIPEKMRLTRICRDRARFQDTRCGRSARHSRRACEPRLNYARHRAKRLREPVREPDRKRRRKLRPAQG